MAHDDAMAAHTPVWPGRGFAAPPPEFFAQAPLLLTRVLPDPAAPAPPILCGKSQTTWAERALRFAMALLFLAALGTLLRLLAPIPGTPVQVDLTPAPSDALTFSLTDPTDLLPMDATLARQSNAAVAMAATPVPASPFRFSATANPARERARDCLAAAAWYEAGDDPSGERAVVQVVLNRARHPAYPASICAVVFQGAERRTGCQFTFTCDGSLAARHPGPAAWARARAVAGAALAGAVDPRVGWATHYHADYVVPKWRNSLDKVAQVGVHLFYRWQGWWGTGPAFRRHAGDFTDEPAQAALAAFSPAHAAPAPSDDALFAALNDKDDSVAADTPLSPAAALADAQDAHLPVQVPGRAQLVALHGADVDAPIRMMLDPALFPGRYAIQALELCGHRPRCLVLGWRSTREQGEAGSTPAELAFVYRRNRDSGGEGAWWDCAATPRTDKSQCLPAPAQRHKFLSED